MPAPVRESRVPNPYSGPIIDAHHHLWDLGLGRHPWLILTADARGGLGDLGPLRQNCLPEDYLRDATRHNVVATVHVEAGWASDDCVGETNWLETLTEPFDHLSTEEHQTLVKIMNKLTHHLPKRSS